MAEDIEMRPPERLAADPAHVPAPSAIAAALTILQNRRNDLNMDKIAKGILPVGIVVQGIQIMISGLKDKNPAQWGVAIGIWVPAIVALGM